MGGQQTQTQLSKESETPPCFAGPSVSRKLDQNTVLGRGIVLGLVRKVKDKLEQKEGNLSEIDTLSALEALENLGDLSTDILRSSMIGKTVNLLGARSTASS